MQQRLLVIVQLLVPVPIPDAVTRSSAPELARQAAMAGGRLHHPGPPCPALLHAHARQFP